MEIDNNIINSLCQYSKLEISDEMYTVYKKDLASIISYMEKIKEFNYNIDDDEYRDFGRLREDKALDTENLDVLRDNPYTKDNYIFIPKALG